MVNESCLLLSQFSTKFRQDLQALFSSDPATTLKIVLTNMVPFKG